MRFVLALLLLAPSVFAALPYNKDLFVYTSDPRGFRDTELQPLFDRLLSGTQPVVLFVHGRGDEPEKSLEGTGFIARAFNVEGKAVQKLEQYGVKVAMVSWDSKRGSGLRDRTRPLLNTPDGGDRFKKVLDALIAAERSNPTHPPVTLLAHSMGTVVVERFVEKNPWPTVPIFNNVILSSADADNAGHAEWVEKIAKVEKVFVTVNMKDRVLKKSTDERPNANVLPLGFFPGSMRAGHATYVPFSTKAHEIFTKDPDRQPITEFFSAVFADRPVN